MFLNNVIDIKTKVTLHQALVTLTNFANSYLAFWFSCSQSKDFNYLEYLMKDISEKCRHEIMYLRFYNPFNNKVQTGYDYTFPYYNISLVKMTIQVLTCNVHI